MLELAPVSPESANSTGSRSYIWDRKQTFMLSPMELGGLIEAVADKKPMKELFHDPGKGRPGWGSPPSTHCVTVRSAPRLGLKTNGMRESNSDYCCSLDPTAPLRMSASRCYDSCACSHCSGKSGWYSHRCLLGDAYTSCVPPVQRWRQDFQDADTAAAGREGRLVSGPGRQGRHQQGKQCEAGAANHWRGAAHHEDALRGRAAPVLT